MFKIDNILAIIFLCLLLYGRLFKKIKNIPLNAQDIIDYGIMFQSLFLINFFLAIVMIIILIKQNKPTEQSALAKFFFYYIEKYTESLDRGLFFFYTKIFNFVIPYCSFYVLKVVKWFFFHKKILIIFSLGIIIPRAIIILTLILEIYSGNLHYYFYTLFLLCIPLMFSLLLYILKDISPRLSKDLQHFWDFVNKDPKDSFSHNFLLIDKEYFINYIYLPVINIENKIKNEFLPQYQKIRVITYIFYFTLSTFCWGYILILFFPKIIF